MLRAAVCINKLPLSLIGRRLVFDASTRPLHEFAEIQADTNSALLAPSTSLINLQKFRLTQLRVVVVCFGDGVAASSSHLPMQILQPTSQIRVWRYNSLKLGQPG